MYKKGILVLVTVVLAVLTYGTTAYAAEAPESIEPYFATNTAADEDSEVVTVVVDGYEIGYIPGAPGEVYEAIADGIKKSEMIALRNDPNSDLYILAHLINGEAGGCEWCSDAMCYYVGSVVLNRVSSDIFPDSIHDVAFQSGQYACTWDGNYDKPMLERSWTIAEDLLSNGSLLPEGVLYQANFPQGSGVYCQEQNMYFCY